MAQISLYVDEATLKKIESAAARQNQSLSKWVVDQIKPKLAPVYPPDFENLFGSVDDLSFSRPDELSYEDDTKREAL